MTTTTTPDVYVLPLSPTPCWVSMSERKPDGTLGCTTGIAVGTASFRDEAGDMWVSRVLVLLPAAGADEPQMWWFATRLVFFHEAAAREDLEGE